MTDAKADAMATPHRRSVPRWLILIVFAGIVVAAPAAANDRYADVDAAGAHHEAIGELADTGITAGCRPDRFCPDDPVSRGQMASFLTRGLPRATSDTSVTSLTSAGDYTGVPASITVEANGVSGGTGTVTLQGSVSVLAAGNVSSCPCEIEAFVYRDSDDAQGPSMWSQLPGETAGSGRAAAALPVSWTTTIPSGSTETFRVAVLLNDGNPTEVTAEATLTAVTTPRS